MRVFEHIKVLKKNECTTLGIQTTLPRQYPNSGNTSTCSQSINRFDEVSREDWGGQKMFAFRGLSVHGPFKQTPNWVVKGQVNKAG
ncbi:hypothetical protein TNCT_251631 [Trichonephila clavata]|uniref:Uncharacterized protein n=1 Tax=Trichonephila clavata TaxID=2740835 RepID=A0A8X6JG80_TRICU|nr:hypothetical protein TNCT_251631 [Trichonephila clavata]